MRKKKKVFIFIHQCVLSGGVEIVFHTLLNNLPVDEYDITVLSVMGYLKGDFEDKLYPSQVKRRCLMWDEFSKTSVVKRFCQKFHNRFFPRFYKWWLKFKKFDVAIAAQEGMYASFVIDNVIARKKILWIHNDIDICHWTLSHFGTIEAEREYYGRFNHIICVSESVAESMSRVFGKLNNLCVHHNPIDTRKIDMMLQKSTPAHPGDVWFVCVGRLVEQKGFDRLIRVCSRLVIEGYQFYVSILGDGQDRNLLEDMLKEYKVKNVELLGYKPNPFVYMRAADWFLQTSRHEGFGLALYEAAYCGVPVITTDVAGARELLGDSEYGIVAPNSEDGIYNAMKRVLDMHELHDKYKTMIETRVPIINLDNRIASIRALLDN